MPKKGKQDKKNEQVKTTPQSTTQNTQSSTEQKKM